MPLLRAMQGDTRPMPLPLRAALSAERKRSPDRLELARAFLQAEGGALSARVHENQASGAATSLAHSDGLAFIPAGGGAVGKGEMLDFIRWGDA
jgi:molybdopterin biosynthesis enzyme